MIAQKSKCHKHYPTKNYRNSNISFREVRGLAIKRSKKILPFEAPAGRSASSAEHQERIKKVKVLPAPYGA